MPLSVGSHPGAYEVLAFIGAGGHGRGLSSTRHQATICAFGDEATAAPLPDLPCLALCWLLTTDSFGAGCSDWKRRQPRNRTRNGEGLHSLKAAATDTTRRHHLNMTSAELVDCNSLAPGSRIDVETKSRHYQIECLGGNALPISAE